MKSLFDECFEPNILPPTPLTPTEITPTDDGKNLILILGITGAIVLIIALIVGLVYFFIIKKKKPVIKKIGYLPGYGSSCADTTNSTSTVQGKSSFSSKNY